MVSKAYGYKTLSRRSPYTDSSISEVHTKSWLVSEQYSVSVIQGPSDMNMRLKTCLDVFSHHRSVDSWSYGPHVSSMKMVPDYLSRNFYASGILQIISLGCIPIKTLMSLIGDNKMVFILSFDPLMTTTMPRSDITVGLKPFPCPYYSVLGHPKDTRHMSLETSSLKHP